MKNKKEIRILGIRRSGNHAITSWIFDNYPGKAVYLNDIDKNLNVNPYYSFAQVNLKGLPFYKCKPKLASYVKYFFDKKYNFVRQDKKLRIEYIKNFTPKDLLIHSYEDYALNDPYFSFFEENRKHLVGISESVLTVIIIRDPFNMIASLLHSKKIRIDELRYYLNLYKSYVMEYLGITESLKGKNVLFINYNQWCLSADYRADLIKQIGLHCSEESYERVSAEGGGSSFDGHNKNLKAKKLHVFNRYKTYLTNKNYLQGFQNDSELLELTKTIFGEIAQEVYA